MYSSSPQNCHYYNNNNIGKPDSSLRYNHDSNTTSSGNGPSNTTPTTPTSWHPMEHDYNLTSPTPTSTSPSFPLQQHGGSHSALPATSTPFVLSHTSSGTQDNHVLNSAGGPPPLLPSYGYGLSHRGFFPRPKLTTTLWEDERTICFQVDANGICVARREDNDMINGTKLLNVAGMSRGKRDGILKNEKGRVVVKVGAMHLKGVWITFERAKILSAQFKIQDILYPLFVENPQTFLYSHPITNPISRLGSFRSFYPPSRDRSTVSSPTAHNSMDSSSLARPEMFSPFDYRPQTSPDGLPPATHTSNYGAHDNVSMDYRSSGPSSDSLTDRHQHHHQHHHSQQQQHSMGASSPSHGSYYNNLLDPNHHRPNEVPFYDTAANTNRETDKLMVSTISSPESNTNSLLDSHSPSFLMEGNKRSASKSGGLQQQQQQPISAFQSIDNTTFHHPQPVYMDPMNTTTTTTTNDRNSYHSHQHYLPNPLSTNSNHNNNNNSILNDISPPGITTTSLGNIDNHNSTADNLPPSSASTTSPPSSPSSLSSSRRDSLVMMNHYPRNGSPQRHHPYANSITPPKLSSMQDYLHHNNHHHFGDSTSNDTTATTTLRKPSLTTPRLHPYASRPLAKELGDLSVKPETDHLTRPW